VRVNLRRTKAVHPAVTMGAAPRRPSIITHPLRRGRRPCLRVDTWQLLPTVDSMGDTTGEEDPREVTAIRVVDHRLRPMGRSVAVGVAAIGILRRRVGTARKTSLRRTSMVVVTSTVRVRLPRVRPMGVEEVGGIILPNPGNSPTADTAARRHLRLLLPPCHRIHRPCTTNRPTVANLRLVYGEICTGDRLPSKSVPKWIFRTCPRMEAWHGP
jgi:hypothetical protein